MIDYDDDDDDDDDDDLDDDEGDDEGDLDGKRHTATKSRRVWGPHNGVPIFFSLGLDSHTAYEPG